MEHASLHRQASRWTARKNQGMRVVLDLTTGLQGQTVTCDNFFTSYALGQELLRRKLTMVGTVRKNKPELPPALLATRDRAVFSSLFAFTETHSLVSYCPKRGKNVLLMSTCHKDAKVISSWIIITVKAELTTLTTYLQILYFDALFCSFLFKVGDRVSDISFANRYTKLCVFAILQMVASYGARRKTNHWPVVVVSTILDVSAINAFVVWREVNPSWERGKNFKRRLFLEKLGKALVSPHMER